MEAVKLPKLVASTANTYCCTIKESRDRERDDTSNHRGTSPVGIEDEDELNFFKSAQWSPDGTSILTSSADNTLRTFIVPPTLLDDQASPVKLNRYTAHRFPTAINCFTAYPRFVLSDPNTTLCLSTLNDLPIRLTNCLSPTPIPVSTYPLVSPTTEAYYAPSSVLWSLPGTHFMAGTDCLIALFDVSRNGEGPVTRLPTIPSKRHKMKGGGVGMRGIVSAMSLQPSATDVAPLAGMLAAGTWTRWVGLYDAAGMGGTVATWSIAEAADADAGIGGTGVTQTLWSSCGRYLYVVERRSRGILVYDVRVTGRLVAWLIGRQADTNQRLGVDAFRAENSMQVLAGGKDGVVRIWQDVGQTEGAVERSWEWKPHDDSVTSAMVHSCGAVIATSSGQRALPDPSYLESDSDADSEAEGEDEVTPGTIRKAPIDNSIKIWSL